LAGEVHAGDAILFKGSRLSGMEKVLQLLFER
jgi:UDP-N-acetylmuramyl pentapeptide synthase